MSIPKSIKTRIMSAAYKAACALSERVFNFTERLRVQKEDSYEDDLFNYRDELADELTEGKELVEVLAAHNDKVQGELDFVHREIYGPDFPTGTWAGYTEREQVPEGAGLPPPEIDEDDAPEGYKAVPCGMDGCPDCAFTTGEQDCPTRDGQLRCIDVLRADRTEVVFVKR